MIMDYTVLENLLPDESYGCFSVLSILWFLYWFIMIQDVVVAPQNCVAFTKTSGANPFLPNHQTVSQPTRGVSYLPVNFICRNVFGKVFILRLILTGSDFKIIIKYYQLTFLHLFSAPRTIFIFRTSCKQTYTRI